MGWDLLGEVIDHGHGTPACGAARALCRRVDVHDGRALDTELCACARIPQSASVSVGT